MSGFGTNAGTPTIKSPLLDKIDQLKAELESSTLQTEINTEKYRTLKLQEENHTMQKDHNQRIYEMSKKIDSGEGQLEQMKRDHEMRMQEQRNRHETERQQVKQNYEEKLVSIRADYQATREDLKRLLAEKEGEIRERQGELSDLKGSYSTEIEGLREDITTLQEGIGQSKSLQEQQEHQYSQAVEGNLQLQREQNGIEDELRDLEKMGKSTSKENKKLRDQIKKLDQLVYGKSKSPYKKFYK